MRLEDMRASENVEDRRGMGVGRTGAGFGLGTIVLLVAGYFLGVSPQTLLVVAVVALPLPRSGPPVGQDHRGPV